MKKPIKTNIHLAYRIMALQVIVVMLASFFALLWYDTKAAYSILLGGVICIVPNLYFAHHFLLTGLRSPKTIVLAFFRAEAFKLLLSALLFWLIMRWMPVSFPLLFVGYFLAQMGLWAAPFLSKQQVTL